MDRHAFRKRTLIGLGRVQKSQKVTERPESIFPPGAGPSMYAASLYADAASLRVPPPAAKPRLQDRTSVGYDQGDQPEPENLYENAGFEEDSDAADRRQSKA